MNNVTKPGMEHISNMIDALLFESTTRLDAFNFFTVSVNDICSVDLERRKTYRIFKYLQKIGIIQDACVEGYPCEVGLAILDENQNRVIRLKLSQHALEEYKNPIKNSPSVPSQENSRSTIEKITCVRSRGDGYGSTIVINDDNNNPIKVNAKKGTWKLLFDLADNKYIGFNEKTKKNVDYLNQCDKCRIYTRTRLQPCQILAVEDGQIRPLIKLESIAAVTLTNRQKSRKPPKKA